MSLHIFNFYVPIISKLEVLLAFVDKNKRVRVREKGSTEWKDMTSFDEPICKNTLHHPPLHDYHLVSKLEGQEERSIKEVFEVVKQFHDYWNPSTTKFMCDAAFKAYRADVIQEGEYNALMEHIMDLMESMLELDELEENVPGESLTMRDCLGLSWSPDKETQKETDRVIKEFWDNHISSL